MATSKPRKTTVEKATPSTSDDPARFKASEIGYLGLNMFKGISNDEIKQELNFPYSLKTYKQMSYHSAINAPLRMFDSHIAQADWVVKPPKDATHDELDKAERVREMMDDMEHSWSDFIMSAMSATRYGFSVHEKVFRRRLVSNGSKYSDGLFAWKKLPIRNQQTIESFKFSEDGNDLVGVKQNVSMMTDPYGRYLARQSTVVLPMSKVVLFRLGQHMGDPCGKSPLRDAYLPWRYLIAIEEIEATGISKDLSGVPVLTLPPAYLAADASPEVQQQRMAYEQMASNLQTNQQAAIILPALYDPDTRQPLFDFKLITNSGSKNFDTVKIKEYYKNLIFTSLFADILIMGQSSTGSFALGQVKNTLTGMAADAILRNLRDVINRDLVKQIYELNGWDVSRICIVDYENAEQIDLDVLGKFYQRVGSCGYLTKDLDVINNVRTAVGIDPLPEDADWEVLLPESTTAAGKGMVTPGEGTSNSLSGNDTSSNNLDNAA